MGFSRQEYWSGLPFPFPEDLPDSWIRTFPWRRDRLPTPVFLGFPGGLDSKESTCNVGDQLRVQSLSWEDPLEEGLATHSSILAWIPMDREAWWATVLGVTKSQTRLSG